MFYKAKCAWLIDWATLLLVTVPAMAETVTIATEAAYPPFSPQSPR